MKIYTVDFFYDLWDKDSRNMVTYELPHLSRLFPNKEAARHHGVETAIEYSNAYIAEVYYSITEHMNLGFIQVLGNRKEEA